MHYLLFLTYKSRCVCVISIEENKESKGQCKRILYFQYVNKTKRSTFLLFRGAQKQVKLVA